MKELTFKEVGTEYKVLFDELIKGLKLKPFYTWEEKYTIFKNMLAQEDSVMMDLVLIIRTAEFCTNIDFEGMTDAQVYNIVAELGLIGDFKYEIEEYLDMPKLIEREKSAYKAVESITEAFEVLLKNFDMTKIQEGFSGLGSVIADGKSSK